eukprot:TRINITY_DN7879_c0_g1_i2.p1 TRINITY_DN7879_c0_g1~~TRINITY_DN7879_c0_g1_i2.p1  ORF type:complete len:262 (+),score=28.87 TRINITY_DN7879_c0_g1_i2:107-892(+)
MNSPPVSSSGAPDALSLQIVSDIHVEFYISKPFPTIPPRTKYLCLLGDIGLLNERGSVNYRNFLAHHADVFKHVFVLLGNHEYYGSRVDEAYHRAVDITSGLRNVTLLQKTSLLLDGFRVLGTTLWSKVPAERVAEVGQCLNDYHSITVPDQHGNLRKLSVRDTNAWFDDERLWLETEIAAARRRKETVVVLTHHAPVADGSHPQHVGSPINGAFVTDLEYMMGPPVAFWGFGHTHYGESLSGWMIAHCFVRGCMCGRCEH